MSDVTEELGIKKAGENIGVKRAYVKPKTTSQKVGGFIGKAVKGAVESGKSFAKEYAQSRSNKTSAQKVVYRKAKPKVKYVYRPVAKKKRAAVRTVYVTRSVPRKKRVVRKKNSGGGSMFNFGSGSIMGGGKF